MPYSVYGRKPKRRDYAFDTIGSKRTLKAAKELAEKYHRAGYKAVHIRKDKLIGHITKNGAWYQTPPKKPKKTTKNKGRR